MSCLSASMSEDTVMKIVKVGDTARAACDPCKKFVGVTYRLRDVPLSNGVGTVKDVIAGVCDQCDSVCVLPHQSVPAVAETISRTRKPVEGRVPAHMIDILRVASVAVGGGSDFVPQLVKYYIHKMSQEDISSAQVARLLQTELATGKAQKRISLKGRSVFDDVELVKSRTRLKTTSDILKGAILKINIDILQKKNKQSIKTLENIAAACR